MSTIKATFDTDTKEWSLNKAFITADFIDLQIIYCSCNKPDVAPAYMDSSIPSSYHYVQYTDIIWRVFISTVANVEWPTAPYDTRGIAPSTA
jgi:hypothetical protein